MIREYKPEDKDAIQRCILELQEMEYRIQPQFWKEPTGVSADDELAAILKTAEKENGKLYVADVDGAVVGFLALSINDIEDEPSFIAKRRGHINELVVLKEYQSQGIAKALMAQAEDHAKEQGCMYTSLIVSKGNSAVEFYQKAGYEIASQSMRKIL